MKKFITYMALQTEKNLLECKYACKSNDRLNYEGKTRFPIIPVIDGYVKKGEPFQVVVLLQENNKDVIRNYELLKEELKTIVNKKEIKLTDDSFLEIMVSKEETAFEELKCYEKLLDSINDNDELYLCITYGQKPITIVEMMALNTSYNIKKNISVGCVVYGGLDRSVDPKNPIPTLYDVTPLFLMSQMSYELATAKVKNPIQIIRNVLNEEDEYDDR